jgi:hypothetical protein
MSSYTGTFDGLFSRQIAKAQNQIAQQTAPRLIGSKYIPPTAETFVGPLMPGGANVTPGISKATDQAEMLAKKKALVNKLVIGGGIATAVVAAYFILGRKKKS